MRNTAIAGFIGIFCGLFGCAADPVSLQTQLTLKLPVMSGPHEDIDIRAAQNDDTIQAVEREDGTWVLDVAPNVPTIISGTWHRALTSDSSPNESRASEWQVYVGNSAEVIAQPGQVTAVELALSAIPSLAVDFTAQFDQVEQGEAQVAPEWTGPFDIELYLADIDNNLDTRFAADAPIVLPQDSLFSVSYTTPMANDSVVAELELPSQPETSPFEVILPLGPAPVLPAEPQTYELAAYSLDDVLLSNEALAALGYDTRFELLCSISESASCEPDPQTHVPCTELRAPALTHTVAIQVRYAHIDNYGCGFVTITLPVQSTPAPELRVWTNLAEAHPYLVRNESGMIYRTDDTGVLIADSGSQQEGLSFDIHVGASDLFVPTGLSFDTLPNLETANLCSLQAPEPQFSNTLGLFVATYTCTFNLVDLPAAGPENGNLKIIATGSNEDGSETRSAFGVVRMLGLEQTIDRPVITAMNANQLPSRFQSTIHLDMQVALNSVSGAGCTLQEFSARLPQLDYTFETNRLTDIPESDRYFYQEVEGTTTAWFSLELRLPESMLDLSVTHNPVTIDLELDSNCSGSTSVKDNISFPLHLLDTRPQWVTATADTGTLHVPATPWHDLSGGNWIPISPYYLPATGLTNDRGAYSLDGGDWTESVPAGEFGPQLEPSYHHTAPATGEWLLTSPRAAASSQQTEVVNVHVHQITQPLVLTDSALITGFSATSDASGPQLYQHPVDAPKKVLYDATSGVVFIVGEAEIYMMRQRTEGEIFLTFDDTNATMWTNPCGSAAIVDAVVSVNYHPMATEADLAGGLVYESQLSLLVEDPSGQYGHCTLSDYSSDLTQLTENYAVLPAANTGNDTACLPTTGSGTGSTGPSPTQAGAALGYFPNVDTFVIATDNCVGTYRVHSPNTGQEEFTRIHRLNYDGYTAPTKIETDPFSSHFFVHYPEAPSGGSHEAPEQTQRFSYATFELYGSGEINPRTYDSYRYYDGLSWDHKLGHPYITGHTTNNVPDTDELQAWISPIVNDIPCYIYSDYQPPTASGQPMWHHLSIQAGARLAFAIQQTVGEVPQRVVAFPLDGLTDRPMAEWPLPMDAPTQTVIDMVQMGPQIIGGLPSKLQPGGVYTLQVMGHHLNESQVCIQGACVGSQTITPTAIRFEVPIDWKQLDDEIPAHVTVLSRDVISSPLSGGITIGQANRPLVYEHQEDLRFRCDSCVDIKLVPTHPSFVIAAEFPDSSGNATTATLSYELALLRAANTTPETLSFNDNATATDLLDFPFLLSRDRSTTLVQTSSGDFRHMKVKMLPSRPESYLTSSLHMDLRSYYENLTETYTYLPYDLYLAQTRNSSMAGLDDVQTSTSTLIDDNTHLLTMHGTASGFVFSVSNMVHHGDGILSRPWLNQLPYSTITAAFDSTTSMPTNELYDVRLMRPTQEQIQVAIVRKDNGHIWVRSLRGQALAEFDPATITQEACLNAADSNLTYLGSVELEEGPVLILYAMSESGQTPRVAGVVVHAGADGDNTPNLQCHKTPPWAALSDTDFTELSAHSIAYSESQGLLALALPTSGQHQVVVAEVAAAQAQGFFVEQLVRFQSTGIPTSIAFSSDGHTLYTLARDTTSTPPEYFVTKTTIKRSQSQ
ncbi:MAG: hypothetical protein VX834_08385 [Myxococcota bacterium]|nr:hypothetical protein [Myxococcota bacterium]